MNILTWIIFGLITGAIANFLFPEGSRGGVLGAVILGVVGAVVGGVVSSALLGVDISGFNITSLVIAVGGALLVLTLARFLRRA